MKLIALFISVFLAITPSTIGQSSTQGGGLSTKSILSMEACFDEFQNHTACGIFWDDLRFPAGIAGRGGAAPADVDVNMGYLLFATNIDEDAFFQIQMPHGYVLGTDLEAHVHWAKSTSAVGDVLFRLSYECADRGEVFTNSLGTTIDFVYFIDDDDTAYKHAIAAVTLTDPGFSGTSGMCIARLWRDVSGDDYAADAIVYEFDVHYQRDQPGSGTQRTK